MLGAQTRYPNRKRPMNKTKKRYLAGLFGVLALCMLPCSSILFMVFVLLAAKFMEPLVVLQHADGKWHEGFKSFEQGKLYYTSRQYNDALRSFDAAVESGLNKADLFASRGGCLQALELHLDAIDDFTKAIELAHEDCNTYYQRAISREAVGDQEGFETDLNKAVLLSQRNSELNRVYNDGVREQGYNSVAEMYSSYLALVRSANGESFQKIKREKAERAQACGRRNRQSL